MGVVGVGVVLGVVRISGLIIALVERNSFRLGAAVVRAAVRSELPQPHTKLSAASARMRRLFRNVGHPRIFVVPRILLRHALGNLAVLQPEERREANAFLKPGRM